MTESEQDKSAGAGFGDLTGAGQIINSKVAERAYDDALSPAMKEVGAVSRDLAKTFRLFLAPLQLAAAYQDRFAAFCNRVRAKVPEDRQQEAPPEIVAPVMHAFATTADNSPLMSMFEELMAKAIDRNESEKLSPLFPELIRSLSPLQAKLVKALSQQDHIADVILTVEDRILVGRLKANYSVDDFGGANHHLTLCQDLADKKLVTNVSRNINVGEHYPNLTIANGTKLIRMVYRLSMFGKWFARACIQAPPSPSNESTQ